MSEDPYALKGKTVIITGASRGIGAATAKVLGKAGANVAILAKTEEKLPDLPGSIHETAEAVRKAGGEALPIACDIRSEEAVEKAVTETVSKFGAIDAVINNASAIYPLDTSEISVKQFDLMFNINVRGHFVLVKNCIPHLKTAHNPHILNIAPPMTLYPEYFQQHLAYTLSKYALTGMTLGLAHELYPFGIAVNSLWPRAMIHTSATERFKDDYGIKKENLRRPDIMAEAARAIITKPARACTGSFLIDDLVLMSEGEVLFDKYAVSSGKPLLKDLFLPADLPPAPPGTVLKDFHMKKPDMPEL